MQATKSPPEGHVEPKRVRSVDAASPPPPAHFADITYERQPPSAVPRRWLLAIVLLLLLNVVATTSISWGPAMMQSARQALATRRAAAAKAQADAAKAAADAAVLARIVALQAGAATYQHPPGLVVYTEDPAEAARLVKEEPDYVVVTDDGHVDRSVRVPHPAVIWNGGTAALSALHHVNLGRDTGIVFMHERTSPGGRRVLVYASLRGDREHHYMSDNGPRDGGYMATVAVKRRLVTWVINPATAEKRPLPTWMHQLRFDQTSPHRLKLRLNPDRSAPDAGDGKVVQPPDVMRFLAGRPDPKDASHFELDYTLDGRPGTIDGWVRDDGRIRLEPREGTTTVERFDAERGEEAWDPYGKAPAATTTTAPPQ